MYTGYHGQPDGLSAAAEAGWDEDQRISSYLRIGRWVILALIVGMGGWAVSLPISGAVIAPGSIAVEARSKTVQHLEGGIIERIYVSEGAAVLAGDPLVRLDLATGGVNREELQARRHHQGSAHAPANAQFLQPVGPLVAQPVEFRVAD